MLFIKQEHHQFYINGTGVARLNREAGKVRHGPATVRGAKLQFWSLEKSGKACSQAMNQVRRTACLTSPV